jgi:hypothetical protein
MIELADLEIKHYRPQAGDIFLVKTPDNLSTAEAVNLRDAVRSAVGEDIPVRVILVFGDTTLEVVRRDDDELKKIILETVNDAIIGAGRGPTR